MSVEAARTSSLTTLLVHILLKKPWTEEGNIVVVFESYIDLDVYQLISASVLVIPTPQFYTNELKSQFLKNYKQMVRIRYIKSSLCYFTKLLGYN